MSRPVLTHVALNCADVQASVEFYRSYAGMEITHERVDDGVRVVWLGREVVAPTFVLVLIGQPGKRPPSPPSIDHLGFACAERGDVDEAVARARAEGVPVPFGPRDLGHPVGYIAILEDPDGNRIELSHGQPIDAAEL